jgi:hypothetical protein
MDANTPPSRGALNHLLSAYMAVQVELVTVTVAELIHRFEYYDEEHNLPLGGKTTIITVELSKTEPLLVKPAAEMSSTERWSVFFRYITDPERRELVNGRCAWPGKFLF